MDERIKAHMALVDEFATTTAVVAVGRDRALNTQSQTEEAIEARAAVEASARQLAEQPGGMKLVPASPTLEVRKHLEGKVGVDFLIAYADWCRPLTASPTEQDAKPKFINEEEAINHYLLTRTPSAPQQAEEILQSLGWTCIGGVWTEDRAATATLASQQAEGWVSLDRKLVEQAVEVLMEMGLEDTGLGLHNAMLAARPSAPTAEQEQKPFDEWGVQAGMEP